MKKPTLWQRHLHEACTRYVHTEGPVDFYTLCASAARYGEIAIGY